MAEENLVVPLGSKHPNICPIHRTPAILQYGNYGPFYRCVTKNCLITGTAHADGRPLGRLATKEVAIMRVWVHMMTKYYLNYLMGWSDDMLYGWIRTIQPMGKPIHISDMFEKDLRYLVREIQREIKR